MTLPTPLAPLGALRQFVPVLVVPRAGGKTDKFPIDYRTGRVTEKGSDGAHDPSIWLSYDEAARVSPHVGFVITAASGFWCVDIDGALQADGTWSPLSLELIGMLPGTVVEVSHSGRGLHIWGRGPIPPHRKKNVQLGVECYSDLRFILLGTQANGTMAPTVPSIAAVVERYFKPADPAASGPTEGPRADWRGPTDDADLIRRALASHSAQTVFGQGVTFRDLWERNVDALARAYPTSGDNGPYDASSADAALCAHLAFWTGCDGPRIDRLMRQSGLAREKYERDDYLPRTIEAIASLQRDVCRDKPSAIEELGLVPPVTPVGAVTPVGPQPAATTSAANAAPALAPAPATVTGSSFLSPEDQTRLFAGCTYVMDQHRILMPGGEMVSPDRFKAKFGGFTFRMDLANEKTTRDAFEAFTQTQALRWPRADTTCFRPQLPFGTIVTDGGRRAVNVYWPVDVASRPGDAKPFLDHIQRLLPNDWQILLAYLAFCVQYKGYKAQWAPLIIGAPGNGKTLLSVVVAHAVGKRYAHWPSAKKLDAQFNGWMQTSMLACVEDVYVPEHRIDLLETLKPYITNSRGLELEKKGVDQFSAEIVLNWIFNSNYLDALKKTKDDRRFAPFVCAQMTYDDLVKQGMHGSYVSDIYDWLDHQGGMEIVAHLLQTWPIPDELNPAKGCPRAPRTSSTDRVIRASLGTVEQNVIEAVEQGRPGFCGNWISSFWLDNLLREINKAGAVPPNKRREMLQSLGYDWHPALVDGRANNVVLPDGNKPRLYVKLGTPEAAITTGAAVALAYQAAQR